MIQEVIESNGPAGKAALTDPDYQPYRIVFENDGLVDMLAVKTFGVNAKEADNPIGFFGTGLKYAIAIILREGGKFSILRGHERFDFTVRRQLVRMQEFGLVYCNDEPLSFTINLGKEWKPWMALRELYCNTVDEKGTVKLQEREPHPEENKTKMWITGEEFGRIWSEERGAFILDTKAIATSPYIDVHPGETKHLYYNGIRAYTSEKPFMYTYNIHHHLVLTEDRTIAWEWQAKDYLYRGFLQLDNKDVLRRLFRRSTKDDKEHYSEFTFKYPEEYQASQEALDVIRELYASKELNTSSGLSYYRDRDFLDRMGEEDCHITDEEHKTLEAVNHFLAACGLNPYFKQIVVTDELSLKDRWYVTTKEMGLGFQLKDRSLVLTLEKRSETLFVARGVLMMGVEETLNVIIEALLDKKGDAKDEMRRAFVKAVMVILSNSPNWKCPRPSTDESEVNF